MAPKVELLFVQMHAPERGHRVSYESGHQTLKVETRISGAVDPGVSHLRLESDRPPDTISIDRGSLFSLKNVLVSGLIDRHGALRTTESLERRLKLLHGVLHRAEECFGFHRWLEDRFELALALKEWPTFGIIAVGRSIRGVSPFPTHLELVDWTRKILPHILCLTSPEAKTAVFLAGHLAYHLRDFGGHDLIRGTGFTQLEVFAIHNSAQFSEEFHRRSPVVAGPTTLVPSPTHLRKT